MELKDIVHISGKPGLFKIIAHGKTNLVVESFDANKTRTSVSISQRFSVLDDISMYTTGDDIRLREVFVKVHDVVTAGNSAPDAKSSDSDLKTFFEKALPEYDKERVHISDIRRLVQWYNLLHSELDFEALRKSKDEEDASEVKLDTHHEVKPTVVKPQPNLKIDNKAKNSLNKTAINRKTV